MSYRIVPSDTIWRHKSGSTLAQVMTCCLTAPSHNLNQCWLIISKVRWHSYEVNLTKLKMTYMKFRLNLPGSNELNHMPRPGSHGTHIVCQPVNTDPAGGAINAASSMDSVTNSNAGTPYYYQIAPLEVSAMTPQDVTMRSVMVDNASHERLIDVPPNYGNLLSRSNKISTAYCISVSCLEML